MQRILNVFRKVSQQRLGFFYQKENASYQQNLDSLRARAHFQSL